MADVEHETALAESSLRVPQMGAGPMTWGDTNGPGRLHPAGYEEEGCARSFSLTPEVVEMLNQAALPWPS
jgi:hypothetical protein